MPIIRLEMVLAADEAPPAGDTLQALADRFGDCLGSGPGETWVSLVIIGRDRYRENGGALPADIRPCFAHVLRYRQPGADRLAADAAALAEIMAAGLGRSPENMHIIFEPDGAGRVAFGGRLVT